MDKAEAIRELKKAYKALNLLSKINDNTVELNRLLNHAAIKYDDTEARQQIEWAIKFYTEAIEFYNQS